MMVQEALGVYERIRSGELNFAEYFRRLFEALPAWASDALDRLDLADVAAVQERLSASLASVAQFLAPKAMDVGQDTARFVISFFVMLYLLFFLLRDGRALAIRMRNAIPLQDELLRNLGAKFTNVVRATIKGNIVVALLQGALGGLIFWLLGIHGPVFWAVVMAFLSLLPAVGTALVWLPVAVYFLASGAIWQGVVLLAYGVLVIGLVDNVVRPMLVGKDTKMPDYVVLVTTLGGMAIFGLTGFVIGPLIAAMFIAAWDTRAFTGHHTRA
jgi:predicted PurR-regulated permease PerM